VTERAGTLKLALVVGSDPITGSLTTEGGTPTSFSGGIELVTAIDAARYDAGGCSDVGADGFGVTKD
jgi:hypothetical protein